MESETLAAVTYWDESGKRKFFAVLHQRPVDSPEKAVEYRNRYGVDGIMIGRASIGRPFIFNEIKHFMATGEHLPAPTISDRVEAAREHLRSSLAWKGPWEGVVEMRRHYGNYLKGLPNVKETRLRLCTERDPVVLEEILDEVIANYAFADVA